jgi:hypothetical protein
LVSNFIFLDYLNIFKQTILFISSILFSHFRVSRQNQINLLRRFLLEFHNYLKLI